MEYFVNLALSIYYCPLNFNSIRHIYGSKQARGKILIECHILLSIHFHHKSEQLNLLCSATDLVGVCCENCFCFQHLIWLYHSREVSLLVGD